MLRQRNVTASENVALGDMTSTVIFIIHIHSLMDTSHIWKGKGWFSPLSMQNIVFQHKMVLDDFFFFLHPKAPSKWEKRRSKTSHSFSATITVTAKLGIAGWGAALLNLRRTLLTTLLAERGPKLIPQTLIFLSSTSLEMLCKVFWELVFKWALMTDFQKESFP